MRKDNEKAISYFEYSMQEGKMLFNWVDEGICSSLRT